jgi:hypothetical protein
MTLELAQGGERAGAGHVVAGTVGLGQRHLQVDAGFVEPAQAGEGPGPTDQRVPAPRVGAGPEEPELLLEEP